jgi:hypothetical protein
VYIVLGVDIPDIYKKKRHHGENGCNKKFSRPMYQKNMLLQQNHRNCF